MMRRDLVILWTTFIVITVVSVSLAQTDTLQHSSNTELAKACAVKLQEKILLTKVQTTNLESILRDYLKNPTAETQKSAEKKIESFLDSRQKVKYEIVKNDWWNTVNKSREN